MDREQYLAKLLGKSFNLLDELSNAAAVASDKLEAVVTGYPVTAKIIYREPIEFKPTAVGVFSTNVLPSFKGGVDAGVERLSVTETGYINSLAERTYRKKRFKKYRYAGSSKR